MFFVLLLLGLQARPDHSVAELVHEGFRVPPHEYRFVSLTIANWPAAVEGTATVTSGAPVRVELLSEHELGNFVRGRSYAFLLRVDSRRDTGFRQAVPDKGEYDLLLVNDRERASDVLLNVSVKFAREPDVARYLSPLRRLTVIGVSLALFLGIISWFGFRLVRAMRDSASG